MPSFNFQDDVSCVGLSGDSLRFFPQRSGFSLIEGLPLGFFRRDVDSSLPNLGFIFVPRSDPTSCQELLQAVCSSCAVVVLWLC